MDAISLTRSCRPAAVSALRWLFVAGLLWTALYLAWLSLSRVDFLYPLWYELLAIDQHIARYAPQNYYKSGFETVAPAQHKALFGQMLEAINRGGQGLAELSYRNADGETVALLREPERVHLDSVALLVERLRRISYWLLGVLLASGIALGRLRLLPPRPLAMLAGASAGAAVMTAGILLYGAADVFSALHEWVFPPGEQWFFYYQESLMTTMLKAPDLFGALAALLALTALLWFVLLALAARRLLQPPLGGAAP